MWIWILRLFHKIPTNQDLPRRVAHHVIKLSGPMEQFRVIDDTACTLIYGGCATLILAFA